MAAKINIFSDEWCSMIFEKKNHAYGAFVLRKESPKRHMVALLIACVVFVLFVSTPILLKSIISDKKEQDLSVRMLSEINLDKPKEENDVLKEVEPPPPPLRNTIKFTPPVITPDDQVSDEEELKTQKEVVENNSAIGTVNFDKGTDDVEVPVATENKVTEEVQEIFVIVEQMPEFPGGDQEMLKFIGSQIRFPAVDQENGIQGVVYVSFVVNKMGKITDIKIMRGLSAGCNAEAMRVIGLMPDWKPGKQGGMSVPVRYTIPIRFTLN